MSARPVTDYRLCHAADSARYQGRFNTADSTGSCRERPASTTLGSTTAQSPRDLELMSGAQVVRVTIYPTMRSASPGTRTDSSAHRVHEYNVFEWHDCLLMVHLLSLWLVRESNTDLPFCQWLDCDHNNEVS